MSVKCYAWCQHNPRGWCEIPGNHIQMGNADDRRPTCQDYQPRNTGT